MFNRAHHEVASTYKQSLMECDLNKQINAVNGKRNDLF